MTTDIDRTWAVRIEAKGLDPVVQGPFTRAQADALLGIYLDADREAAFENDGPTGRRITCEEFDPADRDLSEIIPEGDERFSWLHAIFIASFAVLALYFAFHTYHLQFVTPRPRDAVIAAWLAFNGVTFLLWVGWDAFNRGWSRILGAWARSSRRKQQPAEVAS